ncbi:MAG: sugar-binding transcriptional regulator [Lachnospiraceae bacterium]|nr:sugar-binding transcriptional regulator [Lachnospiraceae bacterium]
MKKIVDDERLIYKVCCLYYQDDMNQKEIGEYLGVSRSSVLRMLHKGKEMGIVTIELHNPRFYDYGEMEKALERAYGLKDVLIVENSVLDTRWENASYMFGSASDYLYSFFKEGDIVGVAMGHTLNSVVSTNKTYEKLNDLMFVTLEGGISQGTVECTDVQGNELVRKFADKFGGTYTQFLSPAVFSDKAILDSFMKEKAVNYILDDFKKINVVVVGIGIPGRIDHTLVRAGYMTNKELKYLSANGAVGDMCLQFFDRNGDTSLFSQYNDRVAAMRLQDIRKVPSKIGIAGGKKKAEAVAGAVRGGFINILIIDSECAKELIDMINE